MFERLNMRGVSQAVMHAVLAINPTFMAGSNMDGFRSRGSWAPAGHHFTLGGGPDVGMVAWMLVAGLVTGGGYLLATAGVLVGIVARFNRLAGRAA